MLLAVVLTASLASCGPDGASSATDPEARVAVTLITKDATNPFFRAMEQGARKAAASSGVTLTLASARREGDDQSQIDAVDRAIRTRQSGILITPMSSRVNSALERARAAGLYVIALDTPPDPAETVDITFATDNRQAGRLIGQYAATRLQGRRAVVALLDVYDDRRVSVDVDRDQGFLEGMGIDVQDPRRNGDEVPRGRYTAGKGGDYRIVGNVATGANADGGRAGMARLLQLDPEINVVYTINEPAAAGAAQALEAAGRQPDEQIVVSVDGGREGVQQVAAGRLAATAQQYPLRMAELGVLAVVVVANGGARPENTPGQDFFDTSVALVAKEPVRGVVSRDPAFGLANAWG